MNDTRRGEGGERRSPERTCVGCGARDAAPSLVRVVLGPRADASSPVEVAVDLAGGSFGRGAHVHPRAACLEKAARGGLARSFRCRIEVTAKDLAGMLAEAADRRMAGLLLGARRAGHLAVGADAALLALIDGAPALIVASDAGTIAGNTAVTRAIAEGKAVAWSTKANLGALFGRDEVALCAVTHSSVAEALLHARHVVVADVSADTRSTHACRVREVR